MWDFNGVLNPERDCRICHSRVSCPLLAPLFGPGGARVNAHAALISLHLTFTFHFLGESQPGASRVDLRDGVHSPVMVRLVLPSAIPIQWRRLRPQLPHLLCHPSSVLLTSKDWETLV